MMKKLIVTLTILIGNTAMALAGNNENFLNMSIGYLLPRGYTTALAFEHEYLYQHGVEIFADFYNGYASSNLSTAKQLTGGIAYKLPLGRYKNTMLRLQIGFKGGSNFGNFVYGPELGLECTFFISGKLQMILRQKNEFNWGASRKFRSGFTAGLRCTL